jgi:hypothetical protein
VQYSDSTFLMMLLAEKVRRICSCFKHEQGCDNSSHSSHPAEPSSHILECSSHQVKFKKKNLIYF